MPGGGIGRFSSGAVSPTFPFETKRSSGSMTQHVFGRRGSIRKTFLADPVFLGNLGVRPGTRVVVQARFA